MKYISLFIVALLAANASHGQAGDSLSLETCYNLAEQNYPLVKQRALLTKSKEFSVENVGKGSYPQISIAGQATYQSDVTTIPIKLPNMEIPTISKDQYRLYGEINQPITDIVTVKQQKALQETSSDMLQQNLEVELYKLRERINQLFFGALLLQEQFKQNELLKADIQTGIDKATAAFQNGVEYKSNLDKLKAELLRAEQHGIELAASRMAYLDMLALFINKPLDEKVVFIRPANIDQPLNINRPELKVFEYQRRGYELQTKLVSTRNLPKFSVFFQGGFGRPSPVNMLSNDVTPYYIGGLRLNWLLTSFYTSAKEKQLLLLNKSLVDAQEETFLFNTQVSLKQQNTEIAKLQALVKTDDAIIALRSSVKEASKAQLENGVITVNDFLREVNAEDQARQTKLLHETQLLMAQYAYRTTAGDDKNNFER